MKLSTENLGPMDRGEVLVGNIYMAKGGTNGKRPRTVYWAVVATTETACSLLGLDDEGHVVTATSYNKHAVQDRRLVGRVPALATMIMEIEP